MSLQQHTGTNFGYSATRLNDLGSSEYTLVTIVNDVSGSVENFKSEMEFALKEAVNSCKHSPRADNLMIRHVLFNSKIKENHGFKLLSDINVDDYQDSLQPQGNTALYDATVDALEATLDYAKKLTDASFNVNAVVFVITDGENNHGIYSPSDVKKIVSSVNKDENLESLVTILIGVNNGSSLSSALNYFKNEGGLNQYVELKDASKSSLAKLAAFVSKSISAQSISLGTGGPSKQLTSGSLTI